MEIAFGIIDWSLVRSFLTVAETGSLSAAARRLGASQPTLGRQIKQIEEQLGAELFIRQPRGFVLTETGQALIVPAQKMRNAMNEIALTVAGSSSRLEGTVRITASETMSQAHLPTIIANIREKEPDIEIELYPSDVSENLLFREADIAVRMYRPKQLDIIAQHIGDIELGIFAAKSYLDRHGRLVEAEDLLKHDVVGYDRDETIIKGMRAAGWIIDRNFFKTRCDNNIAYWQLVRAGCGIGFSQTSIGRNDPTVEEIELGIPIEPMQLWLAAHQVMRQTPRIKRVWELLYEGLKPLVS